MIKQLRMQLSSEKLERTGFNIAVRSYKAKIKKFFRLNLHELNLTQYNRKSSNHQYNTNLDTNPKYQL